MSIKVITTKASTTDQKITSGFRSLLEVEAKISAIAISANLSVAANGFGVFSGEMETAGLKNTLRLQRCYKVISDLIQKVKALNSIETTLLADFKNVAGRNEVTRLLKSIKQSLIQKLNESETYVDQVAIKHFPADYNAIIDGASKDVLERLNYKSRSIKHYVTFDDKEQPSFCKYVTLKRVLNDAGSEHPEYHLVFKISPHSKKPSSIYLNSQYILPHELPAGDVYNSLDECMKHINTSFAADSLSYANTKKKRK